MYPLHVGGRASIVGAAETSVGKVRDHNEDSHFIDPEAGIFIVCDGMGGHAAGEVASALAVKTIRSRWSGNAMEAVADRWLAKGTPDARKELLGAVTQGVLAAHDAIVSEAASDHGKKGMGTTVVAAIIVGGDVVFAHCGDSRAYLVRDGITVQLTEDHTLLARLLAAGVDVDVDGDGARFKSMLTNALGIGQECKVSCFVVPVADGDRFLLCSDGITEYLQENEIGEVLTTMPSPARSAQRLVEIALQRGGGDNATALVVRVLEAGETARPAEQLRREEQAIFSCPLFEKLNPQQRLRALRIALPRDHATGEKVPANTLGDRVSWIIVEGEVEQDGHMRGPGSLLYPEAMLADRPLPDKEGLAIARSEVRALAMRSDDFKELCDDDPEIGEHLLGAIGTEITRRRPQRRTGKVAVQFDADRGATDPGDIATADALQRPATKIDPDGDLSRGDPLQRSAVDPMGDTAQRVAVEPDLSLADPLQRLGVAPAEAPDIARGNTLLGIAGVAPPSADDDNKPRQPQPRASTVPPHTVRTRATTDHGTPVAERTQPELEADEVRRRRARGSTPPSGKSRSGLIVPPADTAADVDEALSEMTDLVDDDAPDDAEISVEREPEVRPTLPVISQTLRPPAPPSLRPPAAPKPAPPNHHSDPEIQIEELVELEADEPVEQHITLNLDDVDDSPARAVSEGDGTITLTVDDASGSVSVEPLVAADSAPHKRPKPSTTDAPE